MIGHVPTALTVLIVLIVGLAAKLTLVPSTLAVYAYVRGLGARRSADCDSSTRRLVGRTSRLRAKPAAG
jgi:hypothetical protein